MPIFSSNKKGKYECRIILLDDTEQLHEITGKTLGEELQTVVFKQLDLREKDYFGLKFKDYFGDEHWLDPNKVVKKQTFGRKAPYEFHLGVKFYAADPTRLREELTRYQFFLQVKKDILFGRITADDRTISELCAYAVQSELGDYNPEQHVDDFVSQFRFVPNQTEKLEEMIADTYTSLMGLQPLDAEMKFLERVKWLDMYGVHLNPVRGQDDMKYLFGLTPTGIVLYKAKNNKIGSFIWPKITKLKYKSNCFLLRATHGRNDDEKEYTFLCDNKDHAKALWKSCAEHHTFFRIEKANDVPASAYNFLFKKNSSSFRFRGRTQAEAENDFDRRPRHPPEFHRTPSQRYKRRSTTSLNESVARDFSNRSNGPLSPLSQTSTISAPWEASFTSQTSGLYSSGPKNTFHQRPKSVNTEYSRDASDRGHSPKNSRRSGYSSGGEIEQRKKKYYSGYTSTSDAESVRKNGTKYGSAPNIHHKIYHHHYNNQHHPASSNNSTNTDYTHRYSNGDLRHQQQQQQHQQQYRNHRQTSRESLPNMQHYGVNQPYVNGYDNDQQKRYRPSGSKSDGEDSSRRHRQSHHHRSRQSDSEMVAPLDVYHNTMGVAHNNNDNVNGGGGSEKKRHRHNRRHHHSQQRHHRSTGHMPAGFDPNQAEVLLELGPGSGSRDDSIDQLSSDKENMHPQRTPNSNGHWNGHGGPPQQLMQQYLPPHLLKQQKRPHMSQGPPSSVSTSPGNNSPNGGGGGYRPQYVEQRHFYHNNHHHHNHHHLGHNFLPRMLPPAYGLAVHLPPPPSRHRLPQRSQSFNRLYKPYKPVVTPARSSSHKNLKSNSSNYNVTTEL